MTDLSNATNEELLMELIHRNGYSDAASRVVRSGTYYECEVSIGDDHSASLVMSDEDYAALRDSLL